MRSCIHPRSFWFIPTCVGNTFSSHLPASLICWFIPTCVGNTRRGRCVMPAYNGSSPRVWGILIEACTSGRLKTVHPHVCGEYTRRHLWLCGLWRFIPTCVGNTFLVDSHCLRHLGSSPRVWGIRSVSALQQRTWRFIPTCVGNTNNPSGWGTVTPVHPHVCGEYGNLKERRSHMSLVHPHVCGEYFCKRHNQ